MATFANIRFVLMVGVGGGVPSTEVDIRLGDVVISQPYMALSGVVQYDTGKATTGGFERTGCLNQPPAVLLQALAQQQANHILSRGYMTNFCQKLNDFPNFRRGRAGPDILYTAEYQHMPGGNHCEQCDNAKSVKRPVRDGAQVVVHYGLVASGNQIIKDGITRDELSLALGKVLCFETEAAGLMNDFRCLVIRGISDYADSHKSDLWQAFASSTAAAAGKELLSIISTEGAMFQTQASSLALDLSNLLELHHMGLNHWNQKKITFLLSKKLGKLSTA